MPEGYTPPAEEAVAAQKYVHIDDSLKTPQFWQVQVHNINLTHRNLFYYAGRARRISLCLSLSLCVCLSVFFSLCLSLCSLCVSLCVSLSVFFSRAVTIIVR